MSLQNSKPEKLSNNGEELPGSAAQGVMNLCDGPCTSSGLKASDLACDQ